VEPVNREPEEILSDADFAGSIKGAPVNKFDLLPDQKDIRGVLTQGLAGGTAETVKLVGEVVGVLASKDETSYLDLVADDASRGAAGGIGRQL
jgi:hypothetical protein